MAKMDKIKFLSGLEVANKDDNSKTVFKVDQATGTTSGKFSAEEVFFTKNFSITEKFGSYGPQDGSHNLTECAVTGKSVADFIKGAFTTTIIPTIKSNPSISIKSDYSVESGTTVTPDYTISTYLGSYSDGTTPKVTFTSYKATCGTETKHTQTGTFMDKVVTTSNSVTVNAEASWGDDTARPKDNQGNIYNDVYIKAGKGTDSYTISAYLPCFYGVNDDSIELSSANIRALGNKMTQSAPPVEITISDWWRHLYIAVPESQGYTSVDVKRKDNYVRVANVSYTEVDVCDARNSESYKNKYRVFHISNAKEFEPITLELTWSN